MSKKIAKAKESSTLAWDVVKAGGRVAVGLAAAGVAIKMTFTDGSFVSSDTIKGLREAAEDLGLDTEEPDIGAPVISPLADDVFEQARPYTGTVTWPSRRKPTIDPNDLNNL